MNIQLLTLIQSQLWVHTIMLLYIWYTVWKNCQWKILSIIDIITCMLPIYRYAWWNDMQWQKENNGPEGYRKTAIEDNNRVKDYERMQANCKGTDGRRDSEQMRILWYCTWGESPFITLHTNTWSAWFCPYSCFNIINVEDVLDTWFCTFNLFVVKIKVCLRSWRKKRKSMTGPRLYLMSWSSSWLNATTDIP